jgi:hypothetical protein
LYKNNNGFGDEKVRKEVSGGKRDIKVEIELRTTN